LNCDLEKKELKMSQCLAGEILDEMNNYPPKEISAPTRVMCVDSLNE
jgi:hypothetical protein